jgi:hypothetical protein
MRTRADAGGPGALGRVRTIWQVALGGLWLAVRALAARAGLTLALTALTAFAVGVAAAGAMYLRAAGESLLQDRLAATSPFSAGLLVERRVATSTEVERLQHLLRHDPRLAVPALTPRCSGWRARVF